VILKAKRAAVRLKKLKKWRKKILRRKTRSLLKKKAWRRANQVNLKMKKMIGQRALIRKRRRTVMKK